MHTSSLLRMRWFAANYWEYYSNGANDVRVLDVGSSASNGSYKSIFVDKRFKYTGLDMVEGPGVDIALEYPYDWSTIPTDTYDIVISGQTFEHTEFFWVTFIEMVRVLKPGGLLCLIAPSSYYPHRYPVDCYRFLTDGVVALARYTGLNILHASTNAAPAVDTKENGKLSQWYGIKHIRSGMMLLDTMLVARKPYKGDTQIVDLKTYKCVPSNLNLLYTSLVPWELKYPNDRLIKAWLYKIYNYCVEKLQQFLKHFK